MVSFLQPCNDPTQLSTTNSIARQQGNMPPAQQPNNVQQIAFTIILPMRFMNKEEHLTCTRFLDGSNAAVTLSLLIGFIPITM